MTNYNQLTKQYRTYQTVWSFLVVYFGKWMSHWMSQWCQWSSQLDDGFIKKNVDFSPREMAG